ncbi:helix-turn-helix transcriptional regulator [Candidatus Dependentiae bacterium]|nr:helix-turn-helix transcriptional regulator [Candidatus Dependentiae bacterium]
MVTTRLRVKELLRERRWTTKVLAEKTGLSESYLTHIKNGTRRWNEDALKKLAEAFELSPYQILEDSIGAPMAAEAAEQQLPEDLLEQTKALNLQLKIIPVVGQIPAQPSEANNRHTQVSTGYRDQFVPVLGQFEDNSMFALCAEDNGMAPNFVKGDFLVICPGMWTNSGDIVAVEYGEDDKQIRAIMQVNYMEDFIVLESVNHKKAPLALVRGKDQFRIIGKVIYRYQKMA